MSEATIRAALYAAVGGVTNVGKVYDYERWTNELGDFLNLFKTTIDNISQIRGWEIGYRAAPATADAQFTRYARRSHTFWVQGYLRLNDELESEKTFSALANAVVSAIDNDTTLHGGTYKFTPPASLEEIVPRMFGGVLCHCARIVVIVPEQVS